MTEFIDSLLTRRSVKARDMSEPGPDEKELQQILAAAHRVPDHGKIGPWRYVIFQGEARRDFSEKLGAIFAAENPKASDKLKKYESETLTRAPVVIAVIASPIEHKVPEWEQILSVGASCQNILIAAQALGYSAQWLTEWYSYHPEVDALLELREKEKIAGFMYIGSCEETPPERPRPDLQERLYFWRGQLYEN